MTIYENVSKTLNCMHEALCDRDDARKKLGEWAQFINFTIYTALDAAKDRRDCRRIVKDTLDAMIKFNAEHEVTITEGGMAK